MKRPSLTEIASYYDRIATRYHEERLTERKLFGDFIEKPAVALCMPAAENGNRLLDIGCGSGLYTKFFASNGFHVTGIDVSSAMIRIAKNYCSESEFPVNFRHVSFEEFVADAHSFDVIFGSFLPGYLNDLHSAFKRMAFWLKDNGVLILSLLHPVRAAASERTANSYVVTDYFNRGIYMASILHDEDRFPLVRHLFTDLVAAAQHADLSLQGLQEPVPCNSPADIDAGFYFKCPSVAVMSFKHARSH